MAIHAPNVPESLITPADPVDAVLRAVRQGDDLEGLLLEDLRLDAIEAERLEFTGCRLVRCAFSEAAVGRLSFTDCAFDHCDFSGVRFHSSSLVRVSFSDCRLTGATFSDCVIAHAQLVDCILSYAGFGQCKLREVRFERCDLGEASLRELRHERLLFDHCNLTRSEWLGVSLRGMDLSSCEIKGIIAQEGALRGAILEAAQLLDLAALMGIVIKS